MNRYTKHFIDSIDVKDLTGCVISFIHYLSNSENPFNFNDSSKILISIITDEGFGFKPSDQNCISPPINKGSIRYFYPIQDKWAFDLFNIKNTNDKLSLVNGKRFTGNFFYDKSLSSYIPEIEEIFCTKVMRDFLETKNEIKIKNSWDSLKDKLKNHRGGQATLLYDFSDQHLYFMKRQDGSIKIGISIHPEIRRKQIQYDIGQNVEILHIVQSGGRTLEKELHLKYSDIRIDGEWFKPEIELIEMIREYKETA